MKNFLASIFSEKLRAVRGSRTQSEMALVLEMKQPMYARYESGTTTPSAEVIYRICQNTGVSSDWLLGLSSMGGPAARATETGGSAKVKKAKAS